MITKLHLPGVKPYTTDAVSVMHKCITDVKYPSGMAAMYLRSGGEPAVLKRVPFSSQYGFVGVGTLIGSSQNIQDGSFSFRGSTELEAWENALKAERHVYIANNFSCLFGEIGSMVKGCTNYKPIVLEDINIPAMYQRALSVWGTDAQIDMCIEECNELIHSLMKHKRNRTHETIAGVAEEVADVNIMIEQMSMIFGASEVLKIKGEKLLRLNQRLNKAETNKEYGQAVNLQGTNYQSINSEPKSNNPCQ